MNKAQLIDECISTMKEPKIKKWYDTHLKGNSQGDTINQLEVAIWKKELTYIQALHIALIVGIQWNVKFEGVL